MLRTDNRWNMIFAIVECEVLGGSKRIIFAIVAYKGL